MPHFGGSLFSTGGLITLVSNVGSVK